MRGHLLRSVLVLAVAAGLSLPRASQAATDAPTHPTAPAPAPHDALQRRALAELRVFTRWLHRYGVQGYVGEVGWPDGYRGDASKWNDLAEQWFRSADRNGLWVMVWATGEWWQTSYRLAAYEDRHRPPGVDSANTQAPVLERHPTTAAYLRGVTVAGGEFGAPQVVPTSTFSNRRPGRYDTAYHFDHAATFRFLASRGVELVRIPFRWERLQPSPGAPLDPNELARLKAVVARAGAAGLDAILDMHNFGGYYLDDGGRGVRRTLGSPELPFADFADVWRRIARNFRHDPAIAGYGLMCEPVFIRAEGSRTPAEVWRAASRRAVVAIRSAGDDTLVLVSGYQWSGVQHWSRWNPRPWIHDDNVRYEAHQYFDRDNSGQYMRSYAAEVRDAKRRGYS